VNPDHFSAALEPYIDTFLRKRRQRLMRHVDHEGLQDLTQELRIALWRAADRADSGHGDLTAFFETILDRHVAKYLRHRFAKKRNPGKERPLDGQIAARTLPDPEAELRSETTDRAVDVTAAVDQLSATDRRLADRLALEGPVTAARSLGLSRSQLETAKRRLRRRFEDAGLRVYR
jgi:RNA polymerase sigma factor (sigma-70 family)